MAGIDDFKKGWIYTGSGGKSGITGVTDTSTLITTGSTGRVQWSATSFPWDDPQHKPGPSEPFEDVLRLRKEAMAFRDMMEYVDVEFNRRIYGTKK